MRYIVEIASEGEYCVMLLLLYSLVFLIASTISLASGIIVLQKHKNINKVFFALTTAAAIWAYGVGLSGIADDAAIGESFLRLAALGWGTVFAIFLHFILKLTDSAALQKKRWRIIFLYLPAVFFAAVFTIPVGALPLYQMVNTKFGWVNAQNGIWSLICYAFCAGYTLLGLLLLLRWGRKNQSAKKKAVLIFSAVLPALVLGTIETVLKSLYPELPHFIPILITIPIVTVYFILKEDKEENVPEKTGRRIDYVFLFAIVIAYMVLSAMQVSIANSNFAIGPVVFRESAVRGLIVQIQMILSLFLVIKEKQQGYVLSVTINAINLICIVIMVAKNASARFLPGIISYAVVLVVIALIRSYQVRNAAYVEKIDKLNKKLAFDDALYRSVFNQAPIGIAVMQDKAHADSLEFGETTMNPTYIKILGRQPEELRSLTWMDVTHPDDLQADLEMFNRFKKGEINGYTMEKRFIRPDGSVVYVNMKISPLMDIYEDHSMHICLIEDITERKQTEFALRESEHRESVLLRHLPGLAYRCLNDYDWTMLYVSDGCYQLTGYAPESLLHNKELSYNDIISPEYRPLLRNEWEKVLAKKEPFKYEYEIITASGEKKWVIEMGQGLYNEAGEVEELEGIVLDISDRKAIEDNLRYMNEHNLLTGLYNRSYLESLLKQDLRKKDELKRAVISINLSTVQLLTANYGFQYTQNLIKKAAEELGQYCSGSRLLFQTYDNQFVFYMIGYQDKNELTEFSEQIAQAMKTLFVSDRIGGGIGVLELEQDNSGVVDVDAILRKLLIASEKSIGIFEKDFGICFYGEELEALLNREKNIRRALSSVAANDGDDNFYLLFQPIFDIKNNSVCGFEALARLKTDELGLISPDEFIPIAEKYKLIIPIGERVFVIAFRFLKKLVELGYDNISVSVNVSVVQLLQPDFASRLFAIIDEMKVNPKNIGIEITESVFVYDYEKINNTLEQLRSAGLHISIDDFGTGYSSLARLRELKVDYLKLDKYFCQKLLELETSKTIINDIISMCHKLDRCVVAEGIEYDKQLQYLKKYNCDRIQGYLLSKPLAEKDALNFLQCVTEQKTPVEV